MDEQVAKVYGNKVRVRACGFWIDGGKLLMANHRGVTAGDFWSPPGGGVDFGLSIADTLKKEFLEETGLHVTPGQFLFGCEYISHPIHSIELFYDIKEATGQVKTGTDPEIDIIQHVRFLSEEDVRSMGDGAVHGIFRLAKDFKSLTELRGFFRI